MGVEMKTPPKPESWSDEAIEGADESNRLPERIARYSKAKKRSQAMSSYISEMALKACDSKKQILSKLSIQIDDCASYLLFRNYFTVGKVRLAKAFFCKKHTLCPMCAIRRGAKTLKAYLDRYRIISKENPELELFMVTLTVKNGKDLKERYSHLEKSVRKYFERRRDSLKKGRGFNEFCKAEGAVYSYEITNKGKGWHPHIHILVLTRKDEMIDKYKLSEEWLSITGDSKIVDVRPVRGEVADGFMEVLKYAMKFSDMTIEQNFQAYEILKGKRMLGSFGKFRGVEVPVDLLDEQLDDLPYIEIIYRYYAGKGYSISDTGNITLESKLNQ
jgi:plasmid rolling circle replication initiator protein Rep